MEEGGEANASRNAVLDMMARRDRDRKIAIEKSQKARQENSEFEGVANFEATFDAKICEIERKIEIIEPSSDVYSTTEELTAIFNQLQVLQKYFTSSTIFLSDHKIKTCQSTINQLFNKCEDKKSSLLPKKKFGFKNKTTSKNEPLKAELAPHASTAKTRKFLWTDSGKRNVLLKFEGNQEDLTFKEMQSCIIMIHGNVGSLQMSNMKNCLILCGPISRSAFCENCENCTIAFACQQLRLHSSSSCDIYIHVTSRAIIEDCKEIHFAPSTYSYRNYKEHMVSSGLDESVNNWRNVGDFNWLSADKPSPNFSEIEEERRVIAWNEFIKEFSMINGITIDEINN